MQVFPAAWLIRARLWLAVIVIGCQFHIVYNAIKEAQRFLGDIDILSWSRALIADWLHDNDQ